ncbi:hypothetical protein [Lactiplantibacillus plantarum]|nr:hypothetical protein G7B65_01575 [Lactiplantibacillus plantarum]
MSYEGGNNTCWYFIVRLVFVRVLGDGIWTHVGYFIVRLVFVRVLGDGI